MFICIILVFLSLAIFELALFWAYFDLRGLLEQILYGEIDEEPCTNWDDLNSTREDEQ